MRIRVFNSTGIFRNPACSARPGRTYSIPRKWKGAVATNSAAVLPA